MCLLFCFSDPMPKTLNSSGVTRPKTVLQKRTTRIQVVTKRIACWRHLWCTSPWTTTTTRSQSSTSRNRNRGRCPGSTGTPCRRVATIRTMVAEERMETAEKWCEWHGRMIGRWTSSARSQTTWRNGWETWKLTRLSNWWPVETSNKCCSSTRWSCWSRKGTRSSKSSPTPKLRPRRSRYRRLPWVTWNNSSQWLIWRKTAATVGFCSVTSSSFWTINHYCTSFKILLQYCNGLLFRVHSVHKINVILYCILFFKHLYINSVSVLGYST